MCIVVWETEKKHLDIGEGKNDGFKMDNQKNQLKAKLHFMVGFEDLDIPCVINEQTLVDIYKRPLSVNDKGDFKPKSFHQW